MKTRTYKVLLLLLICTVQIHAYNLRQISSREGLSNSAILSLCQDWEGYMWIGTCDGLNLLNGNNIEIYKPDEKSQNNLSGNLIEEIIEVNNGVFWIRTNYGLNKLDKARKTIESHTQFEGSYKFTYNKEEEIFVVQNDHKIFYYNKEEKQFLEIPFKGLIYQDILNFFIDTNNTLWIFTRNGVINADLVFSINQKVPAIKIKNSFSHTQPLLFAFQEDNIVYFIDDTYTFYEFNPLTLSITYIRNMKSEILQYGEISTIIKDNTDYLMGFQTNGLIRLKNVPESINRYTIEQIDVHCGVFSLLKDRNQDIIWIGTDGQGVYRLSKDAYSFRSVTYNNLPFRVSKPVRALLVDKDRNLWVGTKDDGILKFNDFRTEGEVQTQEIVHYTTNNCKLSNNSIYAFAESHRNIVWIGGDGPGLNYYSHRDKEIHFLPFEENEQIKYIHALHETNDSTLWMATVGCGILKATVKGNSETPKITRLEQLFFDTEFTVKNHFFTIFQENDSIIWFGNRGYGAVRLNMETENHQIIKFDRDKISPINDIFSIHAGGSNEMWFGTSLGLIQRVTSSNGRSTFKNINSQLELSNNTIHCILEDSQKNLWLSTNRGLIQFNPERNSHTTYDYTSGLELIEFSDGAYFKDEQTGVLYFGGTNGFVTIEEDRMYEKTYTPPVIFKEIRINEENFDIRHLIENETLTLNHKQNFFTISFIALDYINGDNYTYKYKLEGFKDQWYQNGNSNRVTFTNLRPGEYTLSVRYQNGMINNDQSYSLKIKILPPWYATLWAYIIYIVALISLIVYLTYSLDKREKRKRKIQISRIKQQQKEQIYESKLRFFTNITHELCTPLTLITGPCQRILNHNGSDSFVRKYASLIQTNVYRLNELIQDLIEFRRIDTENKKCEIENLQIDSLCEEITQTFTELAESKGISYNVEIKSGIAWCTDKSAITTVITNLISNAFKYTPDGGKITVKVFIDNNKLLIEVHNSGKGIQPKDINLIFDRYKVLEHFENQTGKGLSSRNGLGLAICNSLVKLLEGEIKVESTPNVNTIFRVHLPKLSTNKISSPIEQNNEIIPRQDLTLPVLSPKEYEFHPGRPTLFIIDDDEEMLWFICELFAEQYNVLPISDSTQVIDKLQITHPDIIISDIMMSSLDGIALTRQLKENKITSHIPVILLSAAQQVDEKIKGMESGADIYLTKPFNVEYLKTVVEGFLKRRQYLKDYYESSFSALEVTEGKLLHKEEKEFLNRVLKVIDENITNTEISTQFVADALGLTVRNLYRKLEKITDQTPSTIIKEYRLNIARQLLVQTNLSIDEIIYKSGFSNRGTFFKSFSAKYGCTPKSYREQKMEEVASS